MFISINEIYYSSQRVKNCFKRQNQNKHFFDIISFDNIECVEESMKTCSYMNEMGYQ